MSIIDMHVHTTYSACSNIEIHDLLTLLSTLNIDGIGITDHNEITGAKRAQKYAKAYDVKIFIGTEISTREGQLLAYGIEENLPLGLHAIDAIKTIHNEGGVVVVPHPYREAPGSLGDGIYALENVLDGIEVVNATDTRTAKKEARFVAKQLNLAMTGGSDAHSLDNVGRVATKFDDFINSMDDIVNAIRKKQCQPYVSF